MRCLLAATFVASFAFLPNAALAWTPEEPRVSERTYRIIAYDRSQHSLTVTYHTGLEHRRWQTGHVSRPGLLRFRDTRQCHYELRTSNSKQATSSVNLATGQRDEMHEPIGGNVIAPPSSDPIALNEWGHRTLFGFQINVVEEAERFDDRLEAVDWSVDNLLDLMFTANNSLIAAFDLTVSNFRIIGNQLGRIFGLRTGLNCGEASGMINWQVDQARNRLYSTAEGLEEVDYYFSIPTIRAQWAYMSLETGNFVGAAWVIPEEWLSEYNQIFQYEAQRLADEIDGGVLLTAAERADIRALPIDDNLYRRVIEHRITTVFDRLLTRYNTAAPGLDQQLDDLRALFPDDIAQRARQFSIEFVQTDTGTQDLIQSLGLNPQTTRVSVNNCIVPRLGQATFHGKLDEDPEVGLAIESSWHTLMRYQDGFGNEAVRLAAYLGLLPQDQQAERRGQLDVILTELEERRASVHMVENFIGARRSCENTYLSADPSAGFVEIFENGNWEEIVDFVISNDGVTDPLPDDLLSEIEDNLSELGTRLPDTMPDLNALNQRLDAASRL